MSPEITELFAVIGLSATVGVIALLVIRGLYALLF